MSAPTNGVTQVFGTRADEQAIIKALAHGTWADVRAAVDAAKRHKGITIGCPEVTPSYTPPDSTPPSLAEVWATWAEVHQPRLMAGTPVRPMQGRDWALVALGAYAARLADFPLPEAPLAALVDVYCACQYTDETVAGPLAFAPGAYGYVHTTPDDPYFNRHTITGYPNEGAQIAAQYALMPALFVRYTGDLFAGHLFKIADLTLSPHEAGGMGYNHGIVGVMMLEAAQSLTDARQRHRAARSARLAGTWAAAQPAVLNSNFTAKLVWLLSSLYGWTGEAQWRTALLDKLHRAILPNILSDSAGDGRVAGVPNLRFSELAPVARRPGRFWDNHNARVTYMPMNAWALVAAYVALRDRGDVTEAQRVKPCMVAMLDNLAWEITHLGVPDGGLTSLPYALLLALWQVAQYEGEPHPAWEAAAWAEWNSGYQRTFVDPLDPAGSPLGPSSHTVALALLVRGAVPYVPPHQRAPFAGWPHEEDAQ